MNVLLPKTAEIRRLGESDKIEIKLDVPNMGGDIPLQFWPVMKPPEVKPPK